MHQFSSFIQDIHLIIAFLVETGIPSSLALPRENRKNLSIDDIIYIDSGGFGNKIERKNQVHPRPLHAEKMHFTAL
jgi:hypothetical protein